MPAGRMCPCPTPGAPLRPQVVRPHFQGVTATAIASHPLLKLGTWDPWRPVGELIGQIKTFLEVRGASSLKPKAVVLRNMGAL